MSSLKINLLDTYFNSYIKKFRDFITDKYAVNIQGLADFITADDKDIYLITKILQSYGFEITISHGQDTIDGIQVEYLNKENGDIELFEYKIENLISTINLSSKTDISIVGILVMQIISRIICKHKIIYKAIILDLDDTIWKGTLAEEGIDAIKQNLRTNDAIPFVSFMRFIRTLAKELGLYVAICSRNDIKKVVSAIDTFDEKEFPIKGQIDCIIANYNDKSKNIKAIAQRLSILTNACVFIDDSPLIRDEVRQNLPEVFVPNWKNHNELITLLVACCIFDRFELSLKSRNRKRLLEVLQQEREKSFLPLLFVKVSSDINHIEANRLYAKSNQFRFAEKKEINEGCKSLIYEIYRDNGENLGICSAITYIEKEYEIHILNWAISCRYFEIGLEEYILLYIFNLSNGRSIKFSFNNTGFNGKSVTLIEKYKNGFTKIDKDEYIFFSPDKCLINNIHSNTKLKEYYNE